MPNPRGRRGRRYQPRGRPEIDGRDRADNLHSASLSPGYPAVHFDVPTAAGRQIFSVHGCREVKHIVSPRGCSRHQLAAVRSDSAPVIAVFAGRDGEYFTDYGFQGMKARCLDGLMQEVLSHLTQLNRDSNHQCGLSHSRTDTIWVRTEREWSLQFYTRMDHRGKLYTYPHVGGPFYSYNEVTSAIERYLSDRLDPKMHMERTPEFAIWRELYWPDGTRKNRLKSLPIDDSRRWELQLVQSLVDKYNDDHNLLGDLAYELQNVVRYRYFHDGDSNGRYYHINFTTKTKGLYGLDCGIDNLLFFAELTQKGRDELVVSCICRVDPSDNENGHCYACSSDVKHPKADAYSGGQSESGCLRGMFRFDGPRKDLGHTEAELEAEEASVRRMYKELADPHFMETFMVPIKNIFPSEVTGC